MTCRMLNPRICVAGQPPRAQLEAAAREAGLDFHFIPVSGGQFPADSVEAFAAALHARHGD
jgi:uncharacterized protein (TIGR01244 family)